VITVPVIQAFFLGILRMAAMGAAFYFYKDAHGDATTLAFAGGLAFFAMTGQAVDVLKVAQQVSRAQTTTSVTVQSPTPPQQGS
jgi:hypothetical protein